MRVAFLFILLHICLHPHAQTTADFESGRSLLLSKKYKEAVPYFQKVMTGTDESLKRKTVNFITETWVDHPSDVHIAISGEVKPYGQILIDYMNNTFSGKEAAMSAADHYTAGLIFWSLGSSGAADNIPKAIRQFQMAYGGGVKPAVKYFASALAALKNTDKSIPWQAVLEAHLTAATELNSLAPLTNLGWNNYTNYNGWMASKSKPERDTSRNVFLETLNIVANQFPDSLYKMVDYYHDRSFSPNDQDTVLLNLIDNFLAPAANVPQFRKAVAWNYLYKYFYDYDGKTDEKRNDLLKKIRALYANDDKAVIDLVATFFAETNGTPMAYAMSLNSKWLRSFSPVKLADPATFYYAAAFSEADFTPFISLNGPIAQYIPWIVKGYNDRSSVLFSIMTAGALNENAKAALGQVGTSINMGLIKKLLQMPEFSQNSQLKYVYADMAILNNYAVAINKALVPVQIDELASAFTGWSAAEKKGYDLKVLTRLVTLLQKIRDEVPTSALDLDRLQKAMAKLKTELAL